MLAAFLLTTDFLRGEACIVSFISQRGTGDRIGMEFRAVSGLVEGEDFLLAVEASVTVVTFRQGFPVPIFAAIPGPHEPIVDPVRHGPVGPTLA